MADQTAAKTETMNLVLRRFRHTSVGLWSAQ
jgi:hypothetical protein